MYIVLFIYLLIVFMEKLGKTILLSALHLSCICPFTQKMKLIGEIPVPANYV